MPGDLEYLYLINPECQIITVKVSPPIDKIVASAQHSYIITLVTAVHDAKIGQTKARTPSELMVHFWCLCISMVSPKYPVIISLIFMTFPSI